MAGSLPDGDGNNFYWASTVLHELRSGVAHGILSVICPTVEKYVDMYQDRQMGSPRGLSQTIPIVTLVHTSLFESKK